ncbi:3-hydroxy-9,10-secoandrosta-1,3,5(10)-triene-9,17-dione monooxygenase reductase subunit [Nocardia mangyaensis]|uniref:3-hydroxy-9,10-secoandrosta-1,3,5(10)-triene-9, 17-dione monooxygenase reductase subunit n=1 Tax=Nocardia mangyaensis TaxID=2213200 RepID=UPI0026771338|nr:3-hydroxy-9,10-secoandrosta-1,3,5(10)-triene-9,17-dione monooxygenase reductase subunit [Nocardia mangyaensis]MDO3647778.1 flavin reductase family protein [Nocardia mangyaensis]
MPSSLELSPRRFRDVLGHFATGVVVITACTPSGAPVGFACQSFTALSLTPPLVLFCPVKGSRSWAAIEASSAFCVNVLAAAQQSVCARFGNRDVADKFAGTPWHRSAGGLPVLDGALATIECSVRSVADGGDHWIVVGRVAALSARPGSEQPLLFYRGDYAAIDQSVPPSAPWRADLEHFLTTSDSWL